MPATSANVTLVVPASTRRALERPKAPSALICPPLRRASHTNSATSRITGPKPRITFISTPRPALIGSADSSTFLSWRSLSSSSVLANVGISVSKFWAALTSLSSGGYLTFLSNSPVIVAPVEETFLTLPSVTWERNSGLYGMRTDASLPGANSATLA